MPILCYCCWVGQEPIKAAEKTVFINQRGNKLDKGVASWM